MMATEELIEDDFDRIMHFCEQMTEMINTNVIQLENAIPQVLANIICFQHCSIINFFQIGR